jgi:hypothetical protein
MKNNNSNRTSNKLQLGNNCYNDCNSAASKQYAILAQLRDRERSNCNQEIDLKEIVVNYWNSGSRTFSLDLVAWMEVKNNKQ